MKKKLKSLYLINFLYSFFIFQFSHLAPIESEIKSDRSTEDVEKKPKKVNIQQEIQEQEREQQQKHFQEQEQKESLYQYKNKKEKEQEQKFEEKLPILTMPQSTVKNPGQSQLFIPTPERESSPPLNIVIILDDGREYKKMLQEETKNAMAITLLNTIDSESPFIVSTNTLSYLNHEHLKIEGYLALADLENWVLYKTSDNKFVLGFPKDYYSLDLSNRINLEKIGINSKLFEPLPHDQLRTFLSNHLKNLEEKIQKNPANPDPINVDLLKNILQNTDVRKRIFLTGHGQFAGKLIEERLLQQEKPIFPAEVANLKISDYKNLLNHLNKIGTDFLYVVSCNAGGNNLLEVFREQEMDITKDISQLNYYLTIGALTDEVAKTYKYDFNKFFNTLNDFFEKKITTDTVFNKLISALKTDHWIGNMPSVRFPGKLHYLKVTGDFGKKAEVITYAKATASKLEKKPIIIQEGPEAILLYPMKLEVPLDIKATKIPQLISMIPGSAFHLLKELNAQNFSIEQIITSFFEPVTIASPKVFLIEKIVSSGGAELPSGILEDVMIFKKELRRPNSIIIGHIGDQYYKTQLTWDAKTGTLNPIKFEPIKTSEALTTIKNILTSISVNQEALNLVTGGQESVSDLKKYALEKFST